MKASPKSQPLSRNNNHFYYSRSYAEDVTSVTSGASQGPHSFNLVFVCLCVCVTPGTIPYLSRTVPYHQTQLATYSWPQYSNRAGRNIQTQDHDVQQLGRMSMNAMCMGECM